MKAKVENLEAFRSLLLTLTQEETKGLWNWFYDQENLFPPEDQAKITIDNLSVCNHNYPWPRLFIEDDNSKAALVKAGSFFSETRLKEFLKLEYDCTYNRLCEEAWCLIRPSDPYIRDEDLLR